MLINSIDKKIFWTVASLNRQCENVSTYIYLAYLYIYVYLPRDAIVSVYPISVAEITRAGKRF